ncbi:MAG: Gfo/Idh/MocA family oxidoreductase [Planctomycetota bacterium]|nr:MAG: Gfo/Idh/MocA family oxidoreductase [Planctomycetota bacterium]
MSKSKGKPASRPQAAKNFKQKLSRRRFMNATAAGAGLLALGEVVTQAGAQTYKPSIAAQPGRRILGANDRILMGVIGAGGRARRSIMSELQNRGDVEFVAVCDIYEPNLNQALKAAGGKAKGFNEHEKLLEMKDIDAVIIGSTDHWHERHLIDSVLAGKDVYCEKPLSWSIEQGANMVKHVRMTNRIVQVGMQRRSSKPIMEAKKIVDSGFLGEVSLVRAQWFWNMKDLPSPDELKQQGKLDWERWQAPLPKHKRYPLTPKNFIKYRCWRYFWEYSGGNMTDQGTHLIDVIQWFMNDSKPPLAAQEQGAVYQIKGYETPDTFCAVLEYPKFMATWTLTYTNNYQDSWTIIFQGREGTLELDGFGARFYKGKWPRNWRNNPPKPEHEITGALLTAPHTDNFVECMRSRKEPNAPIEIGHQAVSALHLANAAHHAKQRVVLDENGRSIRT